jgi:hypothetical protein
MCRRGVTISDYDASLLPKAGKAGRSPAGGSMLSRLSPLDNYEKPYRNPAWTGIRQSTLIPNDRI